MMPEKVWQVAREMTAFTLLCVYLIFDTWQDYKQREDYLQSMVFYVQQISAAHTRECRVAEER